MAKRTPRQELRASTTRASYRREKSTAAPPMDLPMPVPIPTAATAAPAPATAATTPALPPIAPIATPPDSVALPATVDLPVVAKGQTVAIAAPLLSITNLPDLLAVANNALGFAASALDPLPAPSQIVQGDPSAAEPPPGRAPAGDARSLRTPEQFVLIYRHGASVISRRGKLGERGAWRVIDYPGPAPAAHAYALECSRLIEQGFRDVD